MSSPFYRTPFWRQLREQALERDRHHCTVPGCHEDVRTSRMHVDHKQTRPNVPYPTSADTLSNLRTLCDVHDRQLKERPGGKRRERALVKGCDANGHPSDPAHPWNRRRTVGAS